MGVLKQYILLILMIGNNKFYIAEEVTVIGNNTKRPDLVIYVNGIVLAVIELKTAEYRLPMASGKISPIKRLILSSSFLRLCNFALPETKVKVCGTALFNA